MKRFFKFNIFLAIWLLSSGAIFGIRTVRRGLFAPQELPVEQRQILERLAPGRVDELSRLIENSFGRYQGGRFIVEVQADADVDQVPVGRPTLAQRMHIVAKIALPEGTVLTIFFLAPDVHWNSPVQDSAEGALGRRKSELDVLRSKYVFRIWKTRGIWRALRGIFGEIDVDFAMSLDADGKKYPVIILLLK